VTDASPLAPTSVAEERADTPFPPQIVEELMRHLTRAARARQLYLPNNPVYVRSIDTLREAFTAVWREAPELSLQITESEFRWFGHTVHHETSRLEGLPWTCYKDGLREITFVDGFEREEMVTFLGVLQRVRVASVDGDDLLTLLWEQEFAFLRYRFVDVGVDAPPILPSAHAAEERQLAMEEVRTDAQTEPAPERAGIVRLEDLDSTLYFLDENEIEYLRGEVQREQQVNLRQNVLTIMLDILELQPDARAREEVCEAFEQFMPVLLAEGDYGSVGYLLRESSALAAQASDLPDALRERIRRLPEQLSEPGVLAQVLQVLDDSPVAPPQAELDALFEQLRPGTLGVILGWLKQAQHSAVRAVLERTATRLAAASTGEMLKLMLAEDPAIAIEAMRRAADLKTPAAVTQLAKVMAEGDAALRLAAVQALVAIGSPGAFRVLESALDDAEREVRMVAVRAVGLKGHRAALARVEAVVMGRAVREADLSEKMAFFEAYGLLAGAEGIAQLDELLNGRSLLLRRRIDPEVRACAARALGKIGTPEALAALRRAGEDKDVRVRSEINRALRGGEP
jgi:hypothetical protein